MTDDREPPRLAAANTDAEIARKRAADRVEYQLRELMANMLRVARGAGQPADIVHQAAQLMEAFDEHFKSAGHYPWNIGEMLSWRRQHDSLSDQADRMEASATDQIIAGALQVVASRLLNQRSQETKAGGDIEMGIRDRLDAREVRREARAAALPKRKPKGEGIHEAAQRAIDAIPYRPTRRR
jgi:hypothetical protein